MRARQVTRQTEAPCSERVSMGCGWRLCAVEDADK